jgi:hypothetical protein
MNASATNKVDLLLGVSPITTYLFPVLLAVSALAAALQLGAADGIAACGASTACPKWTQIMTSERPSTFFSYYENHSDEFLGVPLRSAYQFPSATEGCGPAGNCRPSCTFPDRFPWFVDASGSDATDSHPYRNPSSGSVSSYPEEGVRGFEFIGSFEGSVTGLGSDWLLQAVFFHQQKCYAGGAEYGFVRDALSRQFLFYWSTNSNCGSDNPAANRPDGSLCRSVRNGGTRVQESNGNVALPYSADTKKYQVYIDRDDADGRWKFIVKVYYPQTSTSSYVRWIDPNSPENWRPAPYDPTAIFPIEELIDTSGYVTVGIQRLSASTSMEPDPLAPPVLRAQSVSVGRVRADSSGGK